MFIGHPAGPGGSAKKPAAAQLSGAAIVGAGDTVPSAAGGRIAVAALAALVTASARGRFAGGPAWRSGQSSSFQSGRGRASRRSQLKQVRKEPVPPGTLVYAVSEKSKPGPPSTLYALWAVLLGVSVTLRLWCSVHLVASVPGMDPFVASAHVAARSLMLSALCIAPLASLSSLPRSWGPWVAGLCTLPSSTLIASAGILGFGLSQMTLKLATLSTALTLDAVNGTQREGMWQRLVGTAIVLSGVGVSLFASGGTSALTFSPTVLLALAGTLLSGGGYVMQARLSASDELGSADTKILAMPSASDKQERETTAAVVCQGVSAAVQVCILAFLALRGDTTLLAFPLRTSDVWMWVFEGIQGAFFLRSLQILTQKLGFATTFTMSLCGQLLSAAIVDIQSGQALSLARCIGLGLVTIGAVVGNASGSSNKRHRGGGAVPTHPSYQRAYAQIRQQCDTITYPQDQQARVVPKQQLSETSA